MGTTSRTWCRVWLAAPRRLVSAGARPEAPLIALGGVGGVLREPAKKDAPPSRSSCRRRWLCRRLAIFGSPIVAAILVIEAAGLGGATLPLIVLPGLMAAGIGSLVFIGMGDWTGLSTSAYSLTPLHLSVFSHPTWGQIGWAIVIGLAAAVVTIPVRRLGLATAGLVPKKPFVIIPAVGLVVAAIAIVFDQITDKGVNEVLFDGQSAYLVSSSTPGRGRRNPGAAFLCKGLAWACAWRLPRRTHVPGDVPRSGRGDRRAHLSECRRTWVSVAWVR
jgi:hypothetical protein